MISDELKELIRPVILIQKIIWFVILGSIIFYIGFLYLFLKGNMALTSPIGSGAELLIYLLGGACATGAIYYYRHSLSDNTIRNFITKEVDLELLSKDPRTREVDQERLFMLKSLPIKETKIYALMFELQKNTTVSLILSELVVIFGSSLSFITEDVSRVFPFAIVSLVLCFWMFPRMESIINRAQKLYG